MKLITGNRYAITLENGHRIKGILDEIKYFGGKIYSLWMNLNGQQIYVVFNDVKKIQEIR